MDNRLAYIDQASFLGLRALGHAPLCQVTWIYERAADIDGLRRFHHNLGRGGLLGRRIERSPLPFARHRWAASTGPADLDIATTPLPRTELGAWADECARLPVDPEWGPGWRLCVLSLTDGASAVSLVVSHSVADGVGMSLAIADAARGATRDLGYPAPRSRTRVRAVRQDAGQTVGELSEIARALAAAVRLVRRNRADVASSVAAASVPAAVRDDRRPVVVPALTIYIDQTRWEQRAKSLGGNSNSLFAGFASRIGELVGRVRPGDGLVALSFPVSERTVDDTRANALTSAVVVVDPSRVTTDLRDLSRNIKDALVALQDQSNELLGPLALTPLVPKWLARRLEGMALGTAGLPVGCSNVGELDPLVSRPDGSDADFTSARLIDPHITVTDLEAIGGQLFLASGRVGGRVFITVMAYLIGRENSKAQLRKVVDGALSDMGITAIID